jgi:hypothetical protein
LSFSAFFHREDISKERRKVHLFAGKESFIKERRKA